MLEDRRARQHLARVAQEHLEQQELGARQRQHPLAAPRLVGEAVQAQVLEGERALLLAVVLLVPARRSSARTRASSSRSANGLTR